MVAVTGATKLVGVFGCPVEHSLSPAMHNAAFAALALPYIYLPFCVAPENLPGALGSLASLGIIGVNLTIPHKVAALAYLDHVSPEAREVGAVNTVHCVHGQLHGTNTDGYGFYAPLEEAGWTAGGKRAVILGAGGAARSVAFKLAREGTHVTLSNRTQSRAVSLAESLSQCGYSEVAVTGAGFGAKDLYAAVSECDLLVNTTRLGMYPETHEIPEAPLDALKPEHIVYDLVYNPQDTLLLQRARRRGCRTINGVKMLVHQGAAAFHLWVGQWPPVDEMERAVLSGMT